MKTTTQKNISIVAEFGMYAFAALFISSYFDLDIPTEVLLAKLKSKLLFSLLCGALLVFVSRWSMKALEKSRKEKDA